MVFRVVGFGGKIIKYIEAATTINARRVGTSQGKHSPLPTLQRHEGNFWGW